MFKKELEEWKQRYTVITTVDKKSDDSKVCYTGKIGFVTKSLDEYKMDNNMKIAFICGPPVMMKKSVQILKKKGFHDDQIFVSAERLMYCGVGKCCHCMIHGKLTCKHGPVFRYDQIKGYHND
jgi:NAD(P)H-flavin reductase